MSYAQSQTGGFVKYHEHFAGNQAGLVDMEKYRQWLQGQGIKIQ